MKTKVVLLFSFMLAFSMAGLSQSAAEPLTDNQIPDGISDNGHRNYGRFLADVNNDGIRDFCRAVGDPPNIFISCQMGERNGFGSEAYAFNSSERNTQLGVPGSAWMEDVNGDGRADYCRQVGEAPNRYYAAILAGQRGFADQQLTRIQKSGTRWIIAAGPAVTQNQNQNSRGGGALPGQNTRGSNVGQNTRPAGTNTRGGSLPSTGYFETNWIDYNVMKNGRKGMLIHAKYGIKNALGKKSQLVASFEWRDGAKLKANEAAYRSADGNVMAYINFTPTLDNSVYNDASIFIPYVALNIGDSVAPLRFRLSLYDVDTRKHIAYSPYVNFNFKQ